MVKFLWVGIVTALVFGIWVDGFVEEKNFNETVPSLLETYGSSEAANDILMVGLTLVKGAAAKGAVCLDGTVPAYHLHRGYGSGANSWLIHLQGGAWCNDTKSCSNRKLSPYGSSAHMEPEIAFSGILSNHSEENPEFFNWNRVELRYCDGASFSGDSENQAAKLKFKGQRIWLAAMDDLMSRGMRNANHALLSGCSAGGLSSILHCDEFRGLFPTTTKVKCLSDAGLFLDVVDISGERRMRDFYSGVVSLQGVQENLPRFCTSHLDPTSCFFPKNLIVNITTPLFILNSAYDSWQINNSLAPPSADPHGEWKSCRYNLASCSASQMQILQGFRNQMLNAVREFSMRNQNGMFINSCLVHCQTEKSAWYANESPALGKKTIAEAVGDWYFDRAEVKVVDETCRHLALE
ncbi:pectin acetylesterase 12-like [Pyrus communis]|uniref:pectin acetylesterase 12-like n=1 Tax=Pyrus communis TaxID=23211 RepID=UPI0035BF4BF8